MPETQTLQPETTPTTPQAPTTESAPLNTEALPSVASEAIRDEEFEFLGAAKPSLGAELAPSVPPSASPSPAEVMAAAGAPQQPVQQPPAVPPVPAAAAPSPALVAPVLAPAAPHPQAAPAAAPKTPQQVHEEYQAHRQSSIEKLAATTFQLDATTVEGLQTEPERVIPLLMAQATMAAMEATTVAFSNMLPEAILRVTKQQRDYEQNENDFFTAWPALKDPKFATTLSQTGALYRQMNPTATKEQFIQAVGASVAAALGVQAPVMQPQPQLPVGPRPTPHSPIANSAPRTGPAPTANGNKFAALIDEDANLF